MNRYRLLAVAFFAVGGCASPPVTDAEVDAVYVAALHEYARVNSARGLVLPDSSNLETVPRAAEYVGDWDHSVRGAFGDLRRKAKNRVSLVRLPARDSSLRLASTMKAELKAAAATIDSTVTDAQGRKFVVVTEGGTQRAIERVAPGFLGVITPSQIGISSDRTAAVVYMTLHCGFNCGEGWRYVLRKQQGEWKVVRRVRTFVV